MKATFDNTVSILVQAYLRGELEHRICSACAVGNIVAASIGTKPKEREPEGKVNGYNYENDLFDNGVGTFWSHVFTTSCKEQYINPHRYENEAKEQIDATGYTWQQLAKVEYAFETAEMGQTKDDWMFNGLMAVVEVLADIHGISLEAKEEAKKMFVKV